MRDLVTNSILSRFEGHSSAVSALKFVAGAEGYQFVTTAGNECLLWDFPINKNNSKSIEYQLGQGGQGQREKVSSPGEGRALWLLKGLTVLCKPIEACL